MGRHIIAIGTENGLLYCAECAESENIDIAGQSVWTQGDERELAEWNGACACCNSLLPDPVILQMLEAISACLDIGEAIDIIAGYCETKAETARVQNPSAEVVESWQRIAEKLYAIVTQEEL